MCPRVNSFALLSRFRLSYPHAGPHPSGIIPPGPQTYHAFARAVIEFEFRCVFSSLSLMRVQRAVKLVEREKMKKRRNKGNMYGIYVMISRALKRERGEEEERKATSELCPSSSLRRYGECRYSRRESEREREQPDLRSFPRIISPPELRRVADVNC